MQFKDLKKQFKQKSLNDKILATFIIVSLVLIGIGIIQFILYWILVKPNNPLNMPLFYQDHFDSFMDFFNVNFFVIHNDPYVEAGSSYPPLTLVIAKVFSLIENPIYGPFHISVRSIISIVCFFLIVYVSLFFVLKRYLKSKNVDSKCTNLIALVFLFSAPMLFAFQRGNYLMYTLLFTAIFFAFKDSPNKFVKELSYLSLAVAVATKFYPAIFAISLLKDKRIFATVRTAMYSVILLILPFAFFVGGFNNVPVFVENLLGFNNAFVVEFHGDDFYVMTLANNFSVTQTSLVCLQLITKFNFLDIPPWINMLTKVAVVLFSIIIFFAALFSNKKWKMIAACSLGTVAILNPSYAYTGVFFLIPTVVFLFDKNKTKKDWLYLVMFLIMLCPVQFGYIIPRFAVGLYYGVTTENFIKMLNIWLFIFALAIDAAVNLTKKLRAKTPLFQIVFTIKGDEL